MRVFGEDEPLDFTEPAVWDVTSRGLDQNAQYDLIMMQSSGVIGRQIDEIRIGATWRSVVPSERMIDQ